MPIPGEDNHVTPGEHHATWQEKKTISRPNCFHRTHCSPQGQGIDWGNTVHQEIQSL